MRFGKLSCICLLTALLLGGCSMTQQVEDQAYAIVMGVDHTDTGETQVCVKIPQIAGGSEDGQSAKASGGYFQVAATGAGYEAALERLNWAVPRNLNFSQLKLVVFSEELARSEDFPKLIKAVIQTERLFSAAHVVICAEKAVDFVQAMEPAMGSRLSADITSMFEHYRSRGLIPGSTLADLYYRGMSFYSEPMAVYAVLDKQAGSQQDTPAMALSGSPAALASEVSSGIATRYIGAALFSDNVMRGIFDGAQTTLANLLRSDLSAFAYEFEGKNLEFVPERNTSIKVHTDIEPARIEIGIRLASVSQQEMPDMARLKEAIEEDLRAVIHAAQEAGVEPFGFAEAAVRSFRTIDEWRSYDWDMHFRDADVQIEVTFRRSDA